MTVWFARVAFITFALLAYAYQRRLEEKRKEVELYESAPDFMKEKPEWYLPQELRKGEADRLRNLRDLALGLAALSLLIDLWLF